MQAACVVTCGVVVWMWCGAAAAASRTDGAVPVQPCRCTRAERTEHRAVAATDPPASGQAPQSPSPLSSRARSPSPVVVASAAGTTHRESGTGGRPCVNSYQDGARFVWTNRGNPTVCMFVRSMVNAVRRAPAARPPWRSAAKTWSSARRRGRLPFTGVSDGRVLRWVPAERRWAEHSCSAPDL